MDYTNLSKAVSRALRHEPKAYGLTLDIEGWVPVEALLAALGRRSPHGLALSESDLRNIIRLSAKQRYELRDGRIRALYGHSTGGRIEKPAKQPPEILYHGTDPRAAALILKEGLKPMARQYAHLSADEETARVVGMRKDRHPRILVIRAGDAWRSGVGFYEGNESVWLADHVPPAFIDEFHKADRPSMHEWEFRN
jgi:putative RNA 2'-phosphotransferase